MTAVAGGKATKLSSINIQAVDEDHPDWCLMEAARQAIQQKVIVKLEMGDEIYVFDPKEMIQRVVDVTKWACTECDDGRFRFDGVVLGQGQWGGKCDRCGFTSMFTEEPPK